MKSVARDGERLGPRGCSWAAASAPAGPAVPAASLMVSLMFRTLGQGPDNPRPMTRLAGISQWARLPCALNAFYRVASRRDRTHSG